MTYNPFAPELRDCGEEMRDGECTMRVHHRGRHSTVSFYCDGCGEVRRGSPSGFARDINGDVDAAFCFLCMREANGGRVGWHV